MNGLRGVAVAGAAALLLVSGAVPAVADESRADSGPPVVSSTGLTDGQVVGRGQSIYPVWSDDVGVVKLEVLVGEAVGRTYEPAPSNGAVALSLPKSSNGTDIDVTIRVYDAVGNSGAATTRVHVDLDPPTATFAPPFRSFVGGVVTITVADLPDDVAKIELWDQESARELALATSAPWTLTWDTTGLPTGGRWVELVVYDRVKNFQIYTGFYGVDNDKPEINVEFPAVPGRIGGRSKLSATIVDRSPVDRVEWWVDGAMRGTGNSFDWDTLGENRTATLEIRAFDAAGNNASWTSQVVLDNTGPVITSITPGDRALVRGRTVRTTVRAEDGAGVRRAYLDNAYSVDNPPYAIDAWAGPDGRRTLTWIVTDRLGNQSRMSHVVVVDNTRPALKIAKAPKNGAKVRGTVKVTASAGDRNGISRVELVINGKVVAKDLHPGYVFAVKTGKYGKKIKVQLRAYDRAGNATTTSTRTWHR